MTNRVKAPNKVQMFLLTKETNLEGVPRDLAFRGGMRLIEITQYSNASMKERLWHLMCL